MFYDYYDSPLGKMLIVVDDDSLIGLYFENQKYFKYKIKTELLKNSNNKTIIYTKNWLNSYFNKDFINFEINLKPIGTSYQNDIWNILKTVHGKCTYKDITIEYNKKFNKKTSFRAVANAISKNPISIIIPCHRVIGTNGKLTGYAGGLSKKEWLLNHENNID